MRYLLAIDTPHPSLLPLAMDKLREIGLSVNDVFETPDAFVKRVEVEPAPVHRHGPISGHDLDCDPGCQRVPDAGWGHVPPECGR